MAPKSQGVRARTRALVLQALYQNLITRTEYFDLLREFEARDEYKRVLPEMFAELLKVCLLEREPLDELIQQFADRPDEQLDPVEHAVLYICLAELRSFPEVPFRVAINEALALAHRFGAEDGHKYVNAIVDKAARQLRATETRAKA